MISESQKRRGAERGGFVAARQWDRVFLIDEGGRRKCPHGFMMCLNPICGMNLGECVEFGRCSIYFS